MNESIERINPTELFNPSGFVHVTTADIKKVAFISGQVAYNHNGELVGINDYAAQTRQVFENLGHALKAANAGYNDILKFTFFIKNMNPDVITIIRDVRAQFLDSAHLPASTMVGVAELAKPELLLEVEAYVLVP